MDKLVCCVLVIIAVIAVIWLLFRNSSEGFDPSSYSPMIFNTGLDRTPLTQSANMCDNTKMYSLVPSMVDFGSAVPADCACTEFIRAP